MNIIDSRSRPPTPRHSVFAPKATKTVLTWRRFGTNNFVAKAVGLFINCDKMVGGQFEQGLGNMKTAVQAATREQKTSWHIRHRQNSLLIVLIDGVLTLA